MRCAGPYKAVGFRLGFGSALIPGHVMFKAGDRRVEVMPETFAIPRLTGELVAVLLRVNEFRQDC